MLNNLIAAKATEGSITNPVLPTQLGNPDSTSYINKLIPSVITLILVVGAVIFFFNLVIGAIQWIASGGDKQKIESSRGRITNALIGLVILFAVFAIMKLIEKFFGITILTLDIGSLFVQ